MNGAVVIPLIVAVIAPFAWVAYERLEAERLADLRRLTQAQNEREALGRTTEEQR